MTPQLTYVTQRQPRCCSSFSTSNLERCFSGLNKSLEADTPVLIRVLDERVLVFGSIVTTVSAATISSSRKAAMTLGEWVFIRIWNDLLSGSTPICAAPRRNSTSRATRPSCTPFSGSSKHKVPCRSGSFKIASNASIRNVPSEITRELNATSPAKLRLNEYCRVAGSFWTSNSRTEGIKDARSAAMSDKTPFGLSLDAVSSLRRASTAERLDASGLSMRSSYMSFALLAARGFISRNRKTQQAPAEEHIDVGTLLLLLSIARFETLPSATSVTDGRAFVGHPDGLKLRHRYRLLL